MYSFKKKNPETLPFSTHEFPSLIQKSFFTIYKFNVKKRKKKNERLGYLLKDFINLNMKNKENWEKKNKINRKKTN